MPIYEYHCEECKEPFEVFVRSVKTPIKAVCPQCGGEHVQKAVSTISAVGVYEGFQNSSSCAPSG